MTTPRPRWQTRAFRRWLTILPTRLDAGQIDDVVALFADRLEDTRPSPTAGTALLVASMFDALRHGVTWQRGTFGRTPRRGRRAGAVTFEPLLRDLHYAGRSLRKRPLFTSVAVTALGLGIGGTTAMFSVVDGILLEDLPYDDPGALVSIWKAYPRWQHQPGLEYVWNHIQFPWADYVNVRDHSTTLRAVAGYAQNTMVLTGRGPATEISVGEASANLFGTLGVAPILGRAFAPDEVPPEGQPARVVVLGNELWRTRFGGRVEALGTRMFLDGAPYEIVGVLPDRFRLGSDLIATHENGGTVDAGLRDLWVPLGTTGTDRGNSYEVIGRLASGQTVPGARTEVQGLLTKGPADQVVRVVERKDVVVGGFEEPLTLLLGSAAILMLIACTNVTGLLLGEGNLRTQEISVRSALGASRSRIIRQLLTESALLGTLGAAVGIGLAWAGTDVLLALAPPLPRLEEVGMNGRVLSFAIAAGLTTGLLFGIVPASTHSRHAVGARLRVRGSQSVNRRLQGTIMSVQVGLTVLLLVTGGLFGRSLIRVMSVDPGFDVDGLVTAEIRVPPEGALAPDADLEARLEFVAARSRFYDELLRAIEALPDVDAVAATTDLPFPGGGTSQSFSYRAEGNGVTSSQWTRHVSPNYHEVMGIPLLRGRLLTERDDLTAPGAMLVSESLARRNWPDRSPVGLPVTLDSRAWTIVGVVGDVRQKALEAEVEPTFYISMFQRPNGIKNMNLVVRSSADRTALTGAVTRTVAAVDRDAPLGSFSTMIGLMRQAEADARFRVILTWTFAILATVLAGIGIFGTTARAVTSRAREIGIRSALGADRGHLIRLTIGDGLRSMVAGVMLGLLGAAWLAQSIGHLLYGVRAGDPTTYLCVPAIAGLVFVVAAYLPARRVVRIDPMTVISDV